MTRKWLWAALIFFAGILELDGLRRKAPGDTLSEYVWSKTQKGWVRGPVISLVTWLVYHFSFGNGVPLSPWDLMFALIGAVLGTASTRRGPAS